MTSNLEPLDPDAIRRQRDARARRIDALGVDRSRYTGMTLPRGDADEAAQHIYGWQRDTSLSDILAHLRRLK